MEATDIVLLESERMTDTSDGGGRMTGHAVPDGVLNNVFPKVSRVDSVNGRVNLRKIYMAVRTATLEMAGGAHTIIAAPPADPKIAITLFKTTNSAFDNRTDARNRIESYVVRGPASRMVLYGTQFAGQASITVYQREEEPIPDVATVLCLSTEAVGYTPREQFVRIADISRNEVRSFTYAVQMPEIVFKRRLLTFSLDSVLRYDFPGPELVTPYQVSATGAGDRFTASVVRDSTVQDAARYYGLKALDAPADAGDFGVNIESIYTALVPTAVRETGISLASPGGALLKMGGANAAAVVIKPGPQPSVGTPIDYYLPTPALPGSIQIKFQRDGGITGGAPVYLRDNGDGTMRCENSDGSSSAYASCSLLDYSTGRMTVTAAFNQFGVFDYGQVALDFSWLPASEIVGPSWTRAVPITLATRGTVYVQTLNPLPAPGTLTVAYRVLGRWVTLRDDGANKIGGSESAFGAGNLDYVTGALTVTLGALPGVDSAVVITWGTPQELVKGVDPNLQIQPPLMSCQLDGNNCEPGSLAITWTGGSAADDGAGAITGGATGRVDYGTGLVTFRPTTLPVGNTDYQINSQSGAAQTLSYAVATGPQSFSLGVALRPRSLSIRIPMVCTEQLYGVPYTRVITVVDDGAGGLQTPDGQTVSGTVNYATGAVSMTGTVSINVLVPVYQFSQSAFTGFNA